MKIDSTIIAERRIAEKYAFQDWKVKLYSESEAVDEQLIEDEIIFNNATVPQDYGRRHYSASYARIARHN